MWPVGNGCHIVGYTHEAFKVGGSVLWPIDHAVYEQALAMLQPHLDAHLLVVAWKHGRSMTFAQAVAYAVAQNTPQTH